MKVAIVGAGSLGKAIHYVLEKNNHKPYYITRDNINFDAEIAFLCIPASELEVFLQTHINSLPRIICSCSKGVLNLNESQLLISDFFTDRNNQYVCLSGPNFASEIQNGVTTITTLASQNSNALDAVGGILESRHFIIEKTGNVLAVEIFGICKNIIALACGILDGIGINSQNRKANLRAIFITKMVQEMLYIIKTIDNDASTFELSCGIGDLFLTTTSFESRNYTFGFEFTQPNKTDIQDKKVVEGLRNLQALPFIEKRFNVSLQLYSVFYDIIYRSRVITDLYSIFDDQN